ncbi:hypothetical protein ILUMI_24172 [Ignelater luminosus]|uniref:limulus clotting factor C n=1 Tax=Ignelater luminosus TaxID=2038154 RepID=A0A8K0CAQ0_IGNLU|nr:hypothetical protein ILUMI_24172 [Ignelater luminosus]
MFELTSIFLYILLHLVNRNSARPRPDLLPGRDVCGINPVYDNSRIYGGEEAEIGEFPWMALLEFHKKSSTIFMCSGALINDRYVLTAAHCADNNLFSVRLGEHNVKTEEDCFNSGDCADSPVNIEIQKTVVHEDYNPDDHRSDIALLRLKHKVVYTEFIKPICLPLSSELQNNTFTGLTGVVAGWGKTEDNHKSDVKLKVEVPVVANRDCSRSYLRHQISTRKEHLCAGGVKGENSCNGDSGGPLMYRDKSENASNWINIGILSFGLSKCALENLPAVYTRVTEYMPWILEHLRP